MKTIDFLGIEIDEVAPFVTFSDNLNVAGISFVEKNDAFYFKLELGGLTSYSAGEGDDYVHFDGVRVNGEALLKMTDVKIEELPLNEQTGAEIMVKTNPEEDVLLEDLFNENIEKETIPLWKRLFRPQRNTGKEDGAHEPKYIFGFRRDTDPDQPAIFLFPDNEHKTLLKVRGAKLTLIKYVEDGPDYFYLLGTTFEKHHFPKLYERYWHDPVWLAEQIQSIANKWHEGSITSAAQAFESDLQHG